MRTRERGFLRKPIAPLADISEFLVRVKESAARADREREASERAIKTMLDNPPFEPDLFPDTYTRAREDNK